MYYLVSHRIGAKVGKIEALRLVIGLGLSLWLS